MNALFRKSVLPLILLARGLRLAGKPPPSISLDEPVQAQPLPEPPSRWRSSPFPNPWRCRIS